MLGILHTSFLTLTTMIQGNYHYPYLLMRKLRLREVKYFASGGLASKEENQSSLSADLLSFPINYPMEGSERCSYPFLLFNTDFLGPPFSFLTFPLPYERLLSSCYMTEDTWLKRTTS